jgi:hypothetical protein
MIQFEFPIAKVEAQIGVVPSGASGGAGGRSGEAGGGGGQAGGGMIF